MRPLFRLLWLLVCLLGSSCAPATAEKVQFQEFIGSGFLVGKDGTFFTSDHVVAGCKEITAGNLWVGRHKAIILKVYDGYQLAVGRIPVQPVEVAEVAVAIVLPGEPVYAAGFYWHPVGPDGLFGQLPQFRFVEGRGRNDPVLKNGYEAIDMLVAPGQSGGPVLDHRGLVVGMMQARVNRTKTLERTGVLPPPTAYITTIWHLGMVADYHDVELVDFRQKRNDPRLSAAEIETRAQWWTLQLRCRK